jgi:hypothetical protein
MRWWRIWTVLIVGLLLVPPATAAVEGGFGRYHALVIGNNDYRNLPKLETAVGDAEAVAEVLRRKYGFEVQLMRNATRTDILRALNQYRAGLTEEDNLLVYYAGHGWLDRQSSTGFWQPVDADADDDLNWIANDDLTRRFNAMSARHVMVIADSCYSGTLVRSAKSELPTGAEREAWLARMAAKRSRTAIVSGGLEPVVDAGRGGHSVFASALIEALDGNTEAIEGQSLFQQISRPVVVNADQTPEFSDIRKAGHEGGAFIFVPIIVAPGAKTETTGAPTEAPGSDKAVELAFWQAIDKSERAGDYEAYLAQFPKGSFAPLARSRLAALKEAEAKTPRPKDLAGAWVSEVLVNPYDKGDHHRLHFEFKVIGDKLLGSVIRRSTPDAPRKYPSMKRGIVDGTTDGRELVFRERFNVLFGSKTTQHSRTYTGELVDGALEIVVQDTQGNPPQSFAATQP